MRTKVKWDSGGKMSGKKKNWQEIEAVSGLKGELWSFLQTNGYASEVGSETWFN